MAIKTERFNAGLVTARDAALLNEGELQQADDCIYEPNSSAIYKVPGRSDFGQPSAGAAAVKGGRYLSFEDGNSDVILAYVAASLYSAPYSGTGLTGTFVSLGQAGTFPNAGVPEEILDSIHYENTHFLIVGTGGGSTDNGRVRNVSYIRPAFATVASCTSTTGTPIITTATAGGFAGAVPGQGVSGTNIPANAVVLTKDSNTQITISLNTTGNPGTVTLSGTPSLSLRYAGLQPVGLFGNNGATTAAVIAGTASGVAITAGAWPTTADMGAGYYYFLYTELILNGQDELVESTCSINPRDLPYIHIATPTAEGAAICFELPVNNGAPGTNTATHFQLYMSDRQVDPLPVPSLATFRRVGSAIAITSYSARMIYTFKETSTPAQGAFGCANVDQEAAINQWTNFNNMKIATSVLGTTLFANSTANSPPAVNLLHNFGIVNTGSYSGATVLGIEISFMGVTFSGDKLGAIIISLRRRDRSKESLGRFTVVDRTGRSYTLGGPTDTWGVAWTAADVIDANFEVRVQRAGDADGTQNPGIGSVRIKIYYTGTSINRNGKFFQVITISSQVGIAISAGANYPPPVASTGDIFEGQLVLNNIGADGVIQYSLSAQPEYFPALYQLKFRSKRKSKVTCIKVVNRTLIVGLESSLKRVNYLPRENDPEFEPGRAVEELAANHGIVGPRAAATFTMPGGGPYLAFASYNGPHMTDGVSTSPLNEDLDWTALCAPTYLKYSIMVDYPAKYQLWFYYTPVGATTNTKAIVFHYHPSHLKNGKLTVTGPISVSARCAFPTWLSGVPKLFTGHNTDGHIYIEDRAADANRYVDASGGTIVPTVKTRRIFPNGFMGEAREERVHLRVAPIGDVTTGVCTLTATMQNTGEAAYAASAMSFATNIGGQVVVHSDNWAESFDLKVSKSGALTTGMQLEAISYYVDAPTMESNQKV